MNPLLGEIGRRGVTPDQLTLAGLGCAALAGLALALDLQGLALVLLLLVGAFDLLDGALARHLGRASSLGGFLDSVCDHLGDFALAAGMLYASLRQRSDLRAMLVLTALFGSVFGSHVRARAATLPDEPRDLRDVGAFTRSERLVVLMLGLFGHALGFVLAILAIVNNVSALQRVAAVLNRRGPSASKAPAAE